MNDLTPTADLATTAEWCRLLADPTRLRLLNALSAAPLTVAELTQVTGLGQSRVSTHLGRLREAAWVRPERQGTSTLYAVAEGEVARRWWGFAADGLHDPLLTEERARAREVIRARAGSTWADTVAGRMARHYSPGRTWASFARGIVGLVDLGAVVDIASGDGALAELLAPRAHSVTCLDLSDRVVQAGRARLARLPNVEFLRGDMHALPFADGAFDAALLLGALCYATDPAQVLVEAARVLRPGGLLVAVTLAAHEHQAAVERYDHVQLGFTPAHLEDLLATAGFAPDLCAATQREKRPPHFTVITVHARRQP